MWEETNKGDVLKSLSCSRADGCGVGVTWLSCLGAWKELSRGQIHRDILLIITDSYQHHL